MTSGGDWVEQARRLMESLGVAGAASSSGSSSSGSSSPGSSSPGSSSPGSSRTAAPGSGGDCRWCPLCQAAAVLRGERPEVSAALADILAATASALRQVAGEPGPEQASEPAPEQSSAEGEQPGPTAAPVQRIELA